MVVTVGVTRILPSVAFDPDQPPDAVQELAEGADQESCEVPPAVMDEGEAVKERPEGEGEGVILPPPPPLPPHSPPGDEPYS